MAKKKSKGINNSGGLNLFNDTPPPATSESITVDVDNNLETKNVVISKACYLPKVTNNRFHEVAERILRIQGPEALAAILKERAEIVKDFE